MELKLKNINFKKLYNQIKSSGTDLSKEDLERKVNKMLINIQRIKKYYIKIDKQELNTHSAYKPINNITKQLTKILNEINPNAYLIKHNTINDKFERCTIYLKDCKNYEFSKENVLKLLEGELKIKDSDYQYLGTNLNMNDLNQNKKYMSQNFNKSTIFYDDGIEIDVSSNDNKLVLNQTIAGSKAYIMGGKLENANLIFNGYKTNKVKEKSLPPNYPMGIKGLTGCLSLINIELENINIKANNSSCEDTINFVNANGSINKINIENSFSDALDADFSNLKFNSINISLAMNDCADFSGGNYNLLNLKLSKCGDKGLSIGEKSNVKLNTIKIDNSNIGIANKDSSILKLNKAYLKNLQTCIAAYNKKQEFEGGFVKINYLQCENYSRQVDVDNFSKIILNGKQLTNSN